MQLRTFNTRFQALQCLVVTVSLIGMLVLHALEAFVPPPGRYPDLYPALFSIYSFGHFLLAWVYGTVWQWRCEGGERAKAD